MPLVAGSDAVVTVRPEDLALWTDMPMTTDNVLSGRVRDIIYLGNFLDCRIDIDGYELRVQLNHDEALPRGDRVYLTFAIDACHGLPNEP
jgi:hypothetical protein